MDQHIKYEKYEETNEDGGYVQHGYGNKPGRKIK
jgi:hypothetical protein